MNHKLYICMAGHSEYRQIIWDAVVNAGLEGFSRIMEQLNSPVGRDRYNLCNWPGEWKTAEQLGEARRLMRERTESVMRKWRPREVEAAFINYEPRRYVPGTNTINQRWMLDVLQDGLADNELPFLIWMLQGARDVLNIPLAYYNLPRLTKGELTHEDYEHVVDDAKFYRDHFDYVQVNRYPHNSEERDSMQGRFLRDEALRADTHFRAVSKYNLPIFAMHWLSFRQGVHECEVFNRHAIEMSRQRCPNIVLWIQATDRGVAEAGAQRLLALGEYLKGIDFEECA